LRVYDPGAPMFASIKTAATTSTPAEFDVILTPSDPGWRGTPGTPPGSAPNGSDGAYLSPDNMGSSTGIGTRNASSTNAKFPYVGQGAYVDLGYGFDDRFRFSPGTTGMFPSPLYAAAYASSSASWFFMPRGLMDIYGNLLAPGYCVYDTWSFHYENDGIDEDNNGIIDQGTNGQDDVGVYSDGKFVRLGVDDIGERETTPPYDKPLRGMQAIIRTYERDSRSIRQVRVNQHFMPE